MFQVQTAFGVGSFEHRADAQAFVDAVLRNTGVTLSIMEPLDFSIPVEKFTDAHWDEVERGEREKEARKAAYMDMEDEQDYPTPTEAEMKADYDKQWLDCIGANDL